MKILVLENANYCHPRVSHLLRDMRNTIDVIETIEVIEDHLSLSDYDYVALDLSSNKYDNLAVIDICCKVSPKTPILLILEPDNGLNLSKLLDRGADDFILRPFDSDHFRARVKSLLKRNKVIQNKTQEYGALKFDVITGIVTINNKKLGLTKREHGVLEILFRSKGNMVTKDQIAARLFSLDDEADSSSIRIYVSRLRRKIEEAGMTIRSVRGLGYSLEQKNDQFESGKGPL